MAGNDLIETRLDALKRGLYLQKKAKEEFESQLVDKSTDTYRQILGENFTAENIIGCVLFGSEIDPEKINEENIENLTVMGAVFPESFESRIIEDPYVKKPFIKGLKGLYAEREALATSGQYYMEDDAYVALLDICNIAIKARENMLKTALEAIEDIETEDNMGSKQKISGINSVNMGERSHLIDYTTKDKEKGIIDPLHESIEPQTRPWNDLQRTIEDISGEQNISGPILSTKYTGNLQVLMGKETDNLGQELMTNGYRAMFKKIGVDFNKEPSKIVRNLNDKIMFFYEPESKTMEDKLVVITFDERYKEGSINICKRSYMENAEIEWNRIKKVSDSITEPTYQSPIAYFGFRA